MIWRRFVRRAGIVLGILWASQAEGARIKDTVVDGLGKKSSGQIVVTGSNGFSATSKINSGSLSIELGAGTYTVSIVMPGRVIGQTWVVPDTTATLSIGSVAVTSGNHGGSGGSGSSANHVDEETPTGAVDGVNREFELSEAPFPVKSLMLHRNGLCLKRGLDYTLDGTIVTFAEAATPQTGDLLLAWYRYRY